MVNFKYIIWITFKIVSVVNHVVELTIILSMN